MGNLENLPIMDLSGSTDYKDPVRVPRDWLPYNGYYRTTVKDQEGRQGRGTKDKPGNWSVIPHLVITDDNFPGKDGKEVEIKGKRLATFVTFTGNITKGPRKGQSNGDVFVPPYQRACGLTTEEVSDRARALKEGTKTSAEIFEELQGRECLVRVYEYYNKKRKKYEQKFNFVTPEEFAEAEKSGPSVMRVEISDALKKQINGGEEAAAEEGEQAAEDQDPEY